MSLTLKSPAVFCAIDTPDINLAIDLASRIAPITGGIKLGLEFFNMFGPQGVERVMSVVPDAKLFLDLKFHDIPNTVAGAVKSICRNFSPMYINVHAAGGDEMMRAAKMAAQDISPQTRVLAVTILTSLDDPMLLKIGYALGSKGVVEQMAKNTKNAGLDGVVCSALEIETIRHVCGNDFALMVPGIRPKGAKSSDQKRVMTPAEAVQIGASHIVVGRPITQADDIEGAARAIVDDVS